MNKKVITFAIPEDQKKKLQKMEKYTIFIAAVVAKALGRCPTCGGKWPDNDK
jgi:hypothetical protein